MILFPAAYIPNEELSYSLKSMQTSKILLICRPDFIEDYPYEGNVITDNFMAVDILIAKIEKWIQSNGTTLTGMIGIDDEEQFLLSAKLAEHFSLEFYDDEVLQTASNKYIMKKNFVQCLVPTSKFCLIDNPKKNDVAFPNVLKPICGSGSEFVFVNNDKDELAKNFSIALERAVLVEDDLRFRKMRYDDVSYDSRKQFLVEGYVNGEEYSCDFLLFNKNITLLRVVKKFESEHFGLFKGYFLMNKNSMKVNGIDFSKLVDVCLKVGKSLKINQGVCMVDFKIDKGELFVIETSIRPGFGTFINLMYRMYGYTSLGVMAELKNNLVKEYNISKKEGLVVHVIAPIPGKIDKFEFLNMESLKSAGMVDFFMFNKVGDTIIFSEVDPTDMFLGYLVFQDIPYDDIQKVFKIVDEQLVLEIQHE